MTDDLGTAPIRTNQRWWLWLPLLALVGWLAMFGDKSPVGGDGALSLPTRASIPVQSTAIPVAVGNTGAVLPAQTLEPVLARNELIAKAQDAGGNKRAPARDLFSVRNWNPPPPPTPVVVPVPVAPPMPFSFLGKKLENDAWEIYLARGEQTFIVRTGQVLDGVWRVDKVAPPNLAFTYLPLGQAQTLLIGDSR